MAKHNLNDHELTLLRNWSTINSKILLFQTQSSAFTFERIFGKEFPLELDPEDDALEIKAYMDKYPNQSIGYKLFQHFRFDCQHDYQKFTIYLTVSQQNLLLIHIVRL